VTLYDVLRAFVLGGQELNDAGWKSAALDAIDAHERAAQPPDPLPPRPVVPVLEVPK
jgi:hypothetical protein